MDKEQQNPEVQNHLDQQIIENDALKQINSELMANNESLTETI